MKVLDKYIINSVKKLLSPVKSINNTHTFVNRQIHDDVN